MVANTVKHNADAMSMALLDLGRELASDPIPNDPDALAAEIAADYDVDVAALVKRFSRRAGATLSEYTASQHRQRLVNEWLSLRALVDQHRISRAQSARLSSLNATFRATGIADVGNPVL